MLADKKPLVPGSFLAAGDMEVLHMMSPGGGGGGRPLGTPGKHPGGKRPGGKHPGGEHREIKGAFESAQHLLEFQQHVDAFGYISSHKENISQGLAMPAAYDR